MPWNAVGYFTMWLQTLGFSDVPAATLTALFWGGTALGNLVGGIVGDLLAKRLPNAGRQLTCQVCITLLPLDFMHASLNHKQVEVALLINENVSMMWSFLSVTLRGRRCFMDVTERSVHVNWAAK